MRKITKRSAAVITAAVVAVGGGAAAWAAWSVSASNQEAKATTGSAAPVQIKSTSVTPALVPGNKASIDVSVHNPNAFPVKVKSIDITSITTDNKTCDSTNFSINDKSKIAETLLGTVTSTAHTKTVTLKDAISLASNPNNACQSAALSIKFDVEAESVDSAFSSAKEDTAGSADKS